MSVAIIDYGSGNLHSAAKAFERAARSMENPQQIVVTRDPEVAYRDAQDLVEELARLGILLLSDQPVRDAQLEVMQ